MSDATKKPAWKSKTLWSSILIAIAPLFPPAQAWIAANPEVYNAVLGGLFAVLRFVTKDKLG